MNTSKEKIKLLEVVKNGFGGTIGNGTIVDRREYPNATPIQQNSMLGAPAPKNLHTCVVCQKTDVWSGDWSWFGSIKNLDDGEVKTKVCSQDCYVKYEGRNLFPCGGQ